MTDWVCTSCGKKSDIIDEIAIDYHFCDDCGSVLLPRANPYELGQLWLSGITDTIADSHSTKRTTTKA